MRSVVRSAAALGRAPGAAARTTNTAKPGIPVGTAGTSATQVTAGGLLKGVDVSADEHDNGAINWAQIASSGYAFVAIKVSEGNYYVNPHYRKDAAAATAAGLYVTAYHFANPPKSTGAKQAQYAVLKAGSYKVGGQYLPLVLDLEYDPYSTDDCYGMSAAQMVSWISSFMSEAKTLTGAAPIIYTPRIWWNNCTGNSSAFGGNLLWVPSYTRTPGALPAGWPGWTMWQYSEGGRAPGIIGTVDKDLFSGSPQTVQTTQNAPVSIPIQTLNALTGQRVIYSATGLPPGVTISSAGRIAGAPAAPGRYQVVVKPHGPGRILPGNMSFTWGVSAPAAVALGALAANGEVLAQAPQLGNGWHPLGGHFPVAPAVAAIPNPDGSIPADPLFIDTAFNQQVYIRSVTMTWHAMGTFKCVGAPAAAISGTTLTVACRGTDNALWYNTATWSGVGLPTFNAGWKSLGGTMAGSPAVAPVGGVMWFFVRGTNGTIYTRTLRSRFADTKWKCSSSAAAVQPTTGNTIFACISSGTLYEMVHTVSGWSRPRRQHGTFVGGPGIAATSQQVELFAVGTNHTVAVNGPGILSSLPGTVTGGVGAAALN